MSPPAECCYYKYCTVPCYKYKYTSTSTSTSTSTVISARTKKKYCATHRYSRLPTTTRMKATKTRIDGIFRQQRPTKTTFWSSDYFVVSSTGKTSLHYQYLLCFGWSNYSNNKNYCNTYYNKSIAMAVPTALISGTIAYIVIGAIIHALIISARASGMLCKDNSGIAQVVVSIGVFSTWLFWLSAWMHQWHPLIKPIYEG